jgi:hypothetical protein
MTDNVKFLPRERNGEEVWFEDVFLNDLLLRACGNDAIDTVLAANAERIQQLTPALDALYGDGAVARVLELDVQERRAWWHGKDAYPWNPGPEVCLRLREDAPYGHPHWRRTCAASYSDDLPLTWARGTREVTAHVFVHEDDHTVNLQIELADDHAVLVTLRKDGRSEPSITLWHGSGEHDLEDSNASHLREWFEVRAASDHNTATNKGIQT